MAGFLFLMTSSGLRIEDLVSEFDYGQDDRYVGERQEPKPTKLLSTTKKW
jgi:hypothetical protein